MTVGEFGNVRTGDPDPTGGGGADVHCDWVGVEFFQQIPVRNKKGDQGSGALCDQIAVKAWRRVTVWAGIILGLSSVGCSSVVCFWY